MITLTLPIAGGLEKYVIRNAPFDRPDRPRPWNCVAYAAAHVVVDPLGETDPWLDASFDWERTLAFRHYLWDLGFGVAEAMDTAQRGNGLDWSRAQELIRRALAEARGRKGALIACGAGTDHLEPGPDVTIDDVIRAYEEQVEFVEAQGGRIILMASRALAKAALSADDYLTVYDRILSQLSAPVIIHWLGEMFDPALAGYWGSTDHDQAAKTCLELMASHADKIDGIKISLLSKDKEIHMRRRLGQGMRMYTGDDFNYDVLIAGDEQGYSDALLGIFDAIAPAASFALGKLAAGDPAAYFDVLAPTVQLSRHIFKAPTRFYKTGVVFLAYLNGHQDHFAMIGGEQSARSLLHLADLFRLADVARVLRDPDEAVRRLKRVLAVFGVL